MSRPQFNFIVCNDSRLLQDEIKTLQGKYQENSRKWQRKVFWADEFEQDSFWNSLRQQNLFSEPSLVILRHANELGAPFWKALSGVLAHPVQDVWLILCLEVDYEKGHFKVPAHIQKSSCYLHAAKEGWLREIPPLAGAGLRKYVEKIMKKANLELCQDTFEAFCEMVEPNAAAIENEARKFSLLRSAGLMEQDFLANLGSSVEAGIFQNVANLEKGDWKEIITQTSRIDKSAFLFPLIALLAREFRLLWQLTHNESPPLRPAEAQFKKNLARKLGPEGIAKGFALLADCEYQIKSGRQSPEQTLDFLVPQIINLCAAKDV